MMCGYWQWFIVPMGKVAGGGLRRFDFLESKKERTKNGPSEQSIRTLLLAVTGTTSVLKNQGERACPRKDQKTARGTFVTRPCKLIRGLQRFGLQEKGSSPPMPATNTGAVRKKKSDSRSDSE